MEIRDLLITPLVLFIVLLVAWLIRPMVTDRVNRRYFMPALIAKIIGAIALGMIYQFYYGGGDTFTYFTLGSKYIFEAFMDDPILAIKLIFGSNEYSSDTYNYASKIYTFRDGASYFVVRVAGLFDLMTFHTYSATAVLFATMSFSGIWVLYLTFYRQFPGIHLKLALAILFFPSLVFWGSGILKDPLSLSALGWATFSVWQVFFLKRMVVLNSIILFTSVLILYTVKIYILMCFLPAAIIWIMQSNLGNFKNPIVKILIAPVILMITITTGYYSIKKVGEDDARYNIETVGETARVTAEWIHYVSIREGGSAYTLGDFDYSTGGIVRKIPLAIWVTLFRPYLWESNNIVMAISALESLLIFLLTIWTFYQAGLVSGIKIIGAKPILLFCVIFALTFSFAVGISTYNFGSLVRYKIPMLPYFISGLFILQYYVKRDKYESRLARLQKRLSIVS